MNGARALSLGLVLLALAAGCAEEDVSPGIVGAPKKKPTPGVSGVIGGATPSPTPSPTPGSSATPSPGTNVSSNIDTDATPLPVQTLPPNTQPSPTPTPLGKTMGLPAFLSGTPKGFAFLANTVNPYVLRAADVVGLDENQQPGPTYSATINQPVAIAADGAQTLWVLSSDHVDRLTYDLGSLSRAAVAAVSSGTALAAGASEAWITTSTGTVQKVSSTGAVTTYTGYPSLGKVALDSTYAWVGGGTSTVYRIRRSDGASTSITVGGPLNDLAVDKNGTAWCLYYGTPTYNTGVTRIDGSLTPTSFPLEAEGRAIALDSNRAWIAIPTGLVYYSLGGQKEGNAAVNFWPSALSIDAFNRVWVLSTNGEYNTVWGK